MSTLKEPFFIGASEYVGSSGSILFALNRQFNSIARRIAKIMIASVARTKAGSRYRRADSAASEQIIMNVHLPVRHDLPRNEDGSGMARFFSPMNLARYRKLADGEIAAAERSRVLDVLTDEWGAFIWECRARSGARITSLRRQTRPSKPILMKSLAGGKRQRTDVKRSECLDTSL